MNAETNKLANALALKAAIGVLESHTQPVLIDEVEWRDINSKFDGIALGVWLKDYLRYLKLRDAIRWNPLQPNLFRIVEVTA